MNSSLQLAGTPNKHELCLYELIKAGPVGINKIGSPVIAYGETCLPTTISELGIERGINIKREKRPHIHRHGGKTTFTQYILPHINEATKALVLINKLRKARGVEPIPIEEEEALLSAFSIDLLDSEGV